MHVRCWTPGPTAGGHRRAGHRRREPGRGRTESPSADRLAVAGADEPARAWAPLTRIEDAEDAHLAELDLPGADKHDSTVEVGRSAPVWCGAARGTAVRRRAARGTSGSTAF